MKRSAVALLVTISVVLLFTPLTVEAQTPAKVPRIGVLVNGSLAYPPLEAFRESLRERGYRRPEHRFRVAIRRGEVRAAPRASVGTGPAQGRRPCDWDQPGDLCRQARDQHGPDRHGAFLGSGTRRNTRERPMPRYEFMCEKCKKPFELIMTMSEREKREVKCPKCKGTKVVSQLAGFMARTSKKS